MSYIEMLLLERKKGRSWVMQKEILIVDDQPGIRLLLTDVVESEGYRVITAETGKEALDKIYKHAFDLLILDYKLPVVNGIEVLTSLERENMMIPAILMSGMAEEMKHGAQALRSLMEVLAKPFDIKMVTEMVKSIWA